MHNQTKHPPTLEGLRTQRDAILALAERYGAGNVRVFGSVARGDAHLESDVDLLVTFQAGTSLFELSGFWQDLQELLGYEVNILSEAGLRPHFRQRIESELVLL
jgi:predicted nucleotidyltransferase